MKTNTYFLTFAVVLGALSGAPALGAMDDPREIAGSFMEDVLHMNEGLDEGVFRFPENKEETDEDGDLWYTGSKEIYMDLRALRQKIKPDEFEIPLYRCPPSEEDEEGENSGQSEIADAYEKKLNDPGCGRRRTFR